jgi:hypothetical protein
MSGPGLLFGSYHRALDPFSGAALSVRDLLPLLAGRGWQCRAFCGPHLDAPHRRPIAALVRDPRFATLVGPRCRQLEYGNALVPFSRFELTPAGIPVSTRSARGRSRPPGTETLITAGPSCTLGTTRWWWRTNANASRRRPRRCSYRARWGATG